MKKKADYFIEPRGALTSAAVCFLALSIAFRLVWCLAWEENVSGSLFFTRGLLPLFSCILFIVSLLVFGKRALWVSFFPALLGVLFFILKAFDFVWWHQLLCTILYSAVALLYGTAVFGVAPIKKLLIPLFGLPLTYHIVVQDIIQNLFVYSVSQWMQECSVLCIMAALLCISLAMKDRKNDNHALDRSKIGEKL